MAGVSNFIGKKISLTSKSELRYEGILESIDVEQHTISLSHVRSLGTEERRRPDGKIIPPSDKIYEQVTFRAPDIKDIEVYDLSVNNKEEDDDLPSVDPAILNVPEVSPNPPQTQKIADSKPAPAAASKQHQHQQMYYPPSNQQHHHSNFQAPHRGGGVYHHQQQQSRWRGGDGTTAPQRGGVGGRSRGNRGGARVVAGELDASANPTQVFEEEYDFAEGIQKLALKEKEQQEDPDAIDAAEAEAKAAVDALPVYDPDDFFDNFSGKKEIGGGNFRDPSFRQKQNSTDVETFGVESVQQNKRRGGWRGRGRGRGGRGGRRGGGGYYHHNRRGGGEFNSS